MDLKQQLKMIRRQQEREQKWSARQAQKQMDFQKEMSDTAHQREIADLQKAGLNPVLSAGGNGAASANGAMGTADSILPEMMSIMEQMAASAKGGGTKVVVNNDNNDDTIDTPSEAFTAKQMEQGIHANQGVHHDTANSSKTLDTAKRVREDAANKLLEAIKPVKINTTASANQRGAFAMLHTSLTGEQGMQIYNSVKDLAKADARLGKFTRDKDVAEKAAFYDRVGKQIKGFFSHKLSGKEAEQLVRNLEAIQNMN